MKKFYFLALLFFLFKTIYGQTTGIGLHAGIGTDISLGLAFGGGLSYIFAKTEVVDIETGFDFFYSGSTEKTTENVGGYDNEYTDTTTVAIFSVIVNSCLIILRVNQGYII